ncbi:MAG: rhodanese-like domain-containing protein [Armatimonadota bacterium]|nr:rhodanese-like domain-containing protein [Armatimonadota bacterium]
MRRYALAAVGLAMAVALASGCGGGSGTPAQPVRQDISDTELQAMMADGEPLVILDVRTPSEYESGHIPGSLNIPLAELADRICELDPNVRTACVCSGGVRSSSAADLLVASGFKHVYNLEDGLKSWDGPWQPGCPTCSRSIAFTG